MSGVLQQCKMMFAGLAWSALLGQGSTPEALADVPCREAVKQRARLRACAECPICLHQLEREGRCEAQALLSCTHVYHLDCITAFETFEAARAGQPACPCCRAAYSRVVVHL